MFLFFFSKKKKKKKCKWKQCNNITLSFVLTKTSIRILNVGRQCEMIHLHILSHKSYICIYDCGCGRRTMRSVRIEMRSSWPQLCEWRRNDIYRIKPTPIYGFVCRSVYVYTVTYESVLRKCICITLDISNLHYCTAWRGFGLALRSHA